mmetsp:Transcript_125309/g.366034  ORF Transcript_125309/g.366034 Transcript_125309/m.366034 type:complete len:225 (-) Transcript_125309:192-866(-)
MRMATLTKMPMWQIACMKRGTQATDMCRVLGNRRRRTERSLSPSKRYSRNWFNRAKAQPKGQTMAKQQIQRKWSSTSTYSLKGSNSLLWPSRSALQRRASLAMSECSSFDSPPAQLKMGVCRLFCTTSVGGHSQKLFRPPMTSWSAWKINSKTRSTKSAGARRYRPKRCRQQRPQTCQPGASRAKQRRQDSKSMGSSVLMPMPTRPETSMGPFMADLSMLSRTL